jgi:hypothetical protein
MTKRAAMSQPIEGAAAPASDAMPKIRRAAAETIAEDACAPCAHHHAGESDRYEPAIVREIGPAGLDQRRQHTAREIDLERIKKHPGADQPEHAVMKRRDRQAIEPPSGIDCAFRHTALPCLLAPRRN